MRFWKKKTSKDMTNDTPERRTGDSAMVEKVGLAATAEDVRTGVEDAQVKIYEGAAPIKESPESPLIRGTTDKDTLERDVEDIVKEVGDHADYAESGVFVFGKKIEGRIRKVFFTALAIGFLPPTFIFGVALLICIFLLLFPLATMLLLASFPTIIFSLLILFAVLPVVFPFIIIFLLFTGKGKLSVFSEGKLLAIKLFRWTLPTI